MTRSPVADQHNVTFEGVRQQDESGEAFWSARDLAPLLEYQDWRNFMQVVDKARVACQQSGRPIEDHFGETTKMVPIGSGAQRQVPDVHLSRYACYLIVQNGDPSKPVIANGQTYFALQTRRQELADDAAFARLGAKDIHARKELKKSEKILDHMGSTELAANLFRATQAEEKLRRDGVQGKRQANQTHFEVGQKVRETIRDLGGTMPENLPTPAQSIKQIESAHKKIGKKE